MSTAQPARSSSFARDVLTDLQAVYERIAATGPPVSGSDSVRTTVTLMTAELLAIAIVEELRERRTAAGDRKAGAGSITRGLELTATRCSGQHPALISWRPVSG